MSWDGLSEVEGETVSEGDAVDWAELAAAAAFAARRAASLPRAREGGILSGGGIVEDCLLESAGLIGLLGEALEMSWSED